MSFSFGNGEWKIMGIRSKSRCVTSVNKTITYFSGCLQGKIENAALSAEEWRQAERFSRPERRRQFIEMRTRVRQHLAAYVDCSPQHLNILRTAAGKPYLADYPEVFFNLSHCQKQWVLVITAGRRVGVDIESIRPRKGMAGLVRRCFSDAEQQAWNRLPEEEKRIRFYQCWTAKEAFVKAVGRGIALGLENVQTAFTPQPRLMQIPAEFGDAGHWRLLSLSLKKEWTTTICVEAADDEALLLQYGN